MTTMRNGKTGGSDLTWVLFGDKGSVDWAGGEEPIYNYVRGEPIEPGRYGRGLIDDFPALRVRSRGHSHGPIEEGVFRMLGHSRAVRDPFLYGDTRFMVQEFIESPLAARIEPGAMDIVVRINADHTPGDVGVVHLEPRVPRPYGSTNTPPRAR